MNNLSDLAGEMKDYFARIESDISECYIVANSAREKGLDPDTKVEIPLARNMAERVEGLISVAAPQIKGSGLSERINVLEEEYGSQNWKIAFIIAEEVANEKFCKFKHKLEAMEVALRVGLAYITNGVVASPLEGFVKLELKKRRDNGKEYFCLYFSGPIRSAGTTATCIFVAVSDYIRMKMGYAVYDPSEEEIKRTFSEMEFFHERITNLQYFPSEKEAEFITRHLPVQIDGDPSEDLEVPNYKDLPRISTNRLRNGFCLVMAEGLCQKNAKFWSRFSKWNKEFGMDHWIYLEEFVRIQKEVRAKGKTSKAKDVKILPDFNYIKDLVAGRPVLGYPLTYGGLRLRYGRTRTSGFSCDALHPATLITLDNFIAIGTQLKIERPKKADVLSSCDSIEGPIVKLKDGSVVFVDTTEKAKEVHKNVAEILFLGDILINYGDFLDRNQSLVPCGYNEEWWVLELEKNCGEDKKQFSALIAYPTTKISFSESFDISKKYDIPLHPKFTYHWSDITKEQFIILINWMKHSVVNDEKIIIPLFDKDLVNSPKRVLELLGVPHLFVSNEYVVVEGDWAYGLRVSLGFYAKQLDVDNAISITPNFEFVLDIINNISEIKIRDKSGTYIGARMGRPEKAKMRKLTGSPHVLFPVGKQGGRLRSFQSALEKGKIAGQFPIYLCEKCNITTIYPVCHKCNSKAEKKFSCEKCVISDGKCGHEIKNFKERDIDIKEYFDASVKMLGITNMPELIKGVRGTSNKDHIPEHLSKGIIRAHYNIHVNKDGTVRYDMTEMPITHFKPKEIGTPIEKLHEIGYTKDVFGNELLNEDQILELRCQDLILPSCPESLDEGADYILFRVSKFLDHLLNKFYGLGGYYNLNKKEDLVGHLVIGLSPHTSAGIVGRIIGFSKTQTMLAHPLFHSIMRRDCDGDEAAVMLLMDALLNFSPKLLSNHRGATQDEPLVLSAVLLPREVDDMVFNMDIAWRYPLELYEAALEYKSPGEVKIEILKPKLGTPEEYLGFGFTHDTDNLNNGVRCSSYKTIPTMEEKVQKQMLLSEKIRAVDAGDVAKLVIEKHFIRDIKGNLRRFSSQEFRCVSCNEKFRRPPLKGNCTKCNGRIIFTVSEGNITKYLEPSLSLAERYSLPAYLRQTLALAKQRVELLFGRESDKQEGLGKWFS